MFSSTSPSSLGFTKILISPPFCSDLYIPLFQPHVELLVPRDANQAHVGPDLVDSGMVWGTLVRRHRGSWGAWANSFWWMVEDRDSSVGSLARCVSGRAWVWFSESTLACLTLGFFPDSHGATIELWCAHCLWNLLILAILRRTRSSDLYVVVGLVLHA